MRIKLSGIDFSGGIFRIRTEDGSLLTLSLLNEDFPGAGSTTGVNTLCVDYTYVSEGTEHVCSCTSCVGMSSAVPREGMTDGKVYIGSDNPGIYGERLTGRNYAQCWIDVTDPGASQGSSGSRSAAQAEPSEVTSVNGKTGEVFLSASDVGAVPLPLMGQPDGVATLDSTGHIPDSQIPASVSSVATYAQRVLFPAEGRPNVLYVALDENRCYVWNVSYYDEVSGAYDIATSSLPGLLRTLDGDAAHFLNGNGMWSAVTASDVGLGSVANTGDSAVPVENGTTKFTTGGAYTELAKKADKSDTSTELAKKVDKTTTVNGHALSADVTVTKSDVGLGSVVNTGDSAVPVENGTTKFTTGGAYTELAKKADKTTTVNGHALSADVTVTKSDVGLGSVVNTGDSAVPVENGTTKFTTGGAYTELAKKADKTTTVNGHALSSNVTVTKSDVGLGSVVNTGDSATPVSGGTTKFTTGGAYTELAKKVDKTTTVNGHALSSNVTVTASDVGAYVKPGTGIPKSDLASGVQASLGAADTALQGIKVNGTAVTPVSGVAGISVPVPASASPVVDGAASAGTSAEYARADHVHPTDTTREAVANKEQTLSTASTTAYPSSKAVADFVNSSIATNTANFKGTLSEETDLGLTSSATNAQIAAALGSYSWSPSPTNNDYCFVSVNDSATVDIDEYRRFKYNGSTWEYEYTLNNSSYTQAQWDAINSGINTTKVSTYSAHVASTGNPHSVTKAQVGLGSVVNTGDSAVPVENGTTKLTTGGAYTELAKKVDKTTTVNGHALSSDVTVTKSDVGLGNADNTADADKNVLTAKRIVNTETTIKTGNTSQQRITLNTLMTWLLAQQYIPSETACSVIIQTSWSYAANDILQLNISDTDYELQLAGVIIEVIGTVTDYQTGVFRLRIHSSPTTSFTITSGYSTFPVNHIAEYTCNGPYYAPTWKMFLTNDDVTVATQSAKGLMSAADKTKLDSIAAGAQVNTVTGVKGNAEADYRTGNINITAANVGAVPASDKGAANGVASLGADGKVPASQLPYIGGSSAEATLLVGTSAGIKYSTDKGHTWQDSDITSGDYRAFGIFPDGSCIACTRSNVNKVKYSTDNGHTWQNSNSGDGYYGVLGVFPDGSCLLSSYSTGIGIKYSTDKGHTWQDSDITSGNYRAFGIFPDGSCIAGSNNNGIKYSTDKGHTWQDSNITSGDYTALAVFPDGSCVAGSSTSNPKYSTDKGHTWQNSTGSAGPITVFALFPDGSCLACGGTGIKYSTDKGHTWQDSDITSGDYRAFGIFPDGSCIAGSNNNGIKYSTDKGHTWQNSDITSGTYNFLAVLPDGSCVAGNRTSIGIKYSTDKGHTWQNSNNTTATCYAFSAILANWPVTTDATGKIPDSYLPDWLLALKPST